MSYVSKPPVGAIDYYDMAILNLNEALNKLPVNSEGWTKIMEVRAKYDDRLETLRKHENSKYNLSSIVTNAVTSGGTASTSSKKVLLELTHLQ